MPSSAGIDAGRFRDWTSVGIIVSGACLAYATSFFGVPVFDDHAVLADPAAQSLDAWFRNLGHGLRPLLKLSYLAGRTPDNVVGLHIVNLLIHIAVSLTLFFIAHKALPPHDRAGRMAPALWVALLFAVHPVHTEAVTYISGRSSALAALFCGLSLLCCSAREGRYGRLKAYVVSPLFFLAAVLTKETTILLPAGLFWWLVCIGKQSVPGAFARLWVHGCVALGAVVLVLVNTRMFVLALDAIGRHSLYEGVVRQAYGVMYLFSRLVLVNRLCIDPALDGVGHGALFSGIATTAAVSLCVAAVFLVKRHPVAAFGLGWCMLFIYIEYIVLPRPDLINERHMYLANMGLFLLVGWLAGRVVTTVTGQSARWIQWAGVAIMLILSIAANLRSLQYHDAVTLWSSTVSVAPHNGRAWNNLGLAWERRHEFIRARACYKMAVATDDGFGASVEHLDRVGKRIEAGR